MRVVLLPDAARKEAQTEGERRALAGEALILARVAHPGVVRLIDTPGDPPEALVLERASGGNLENLGPQPAVEVAAWGAALFTTLADLHELGWAHGGLTEEHVLFDQSGRPILCSFGRARPLGRDRRFAARLVRADVAAMAGIVESRLPAGEKQLRALLAAAAGEAHARRRLRRLGAPGARRLAEALAARAKAAPTTGGLQRRAARRTALALCALSAAGAGTWWALGDRHRPPPAPERHQLILVAAAGQRYSLSVPPGEHDVALAGRWHCGGVQMAVLDTASGWLWLMTSLPPPGGAAVGRPVGRFRAATALRAVPLGRCERLEILRNPRRTAEGSGR